MKSSIFYAFLMTALVAGVAGVAPAQTPQQLEMLRAKGYATDQGAADNGAAATTQSAKQSASQSVYKGKDGRFVIPENSKEMMKMDDGSEQPVPLAKTDAEIKATLRGPNMKLMREMSPEEQDKYMQYLIQDRIILSTSDYNVITAPSGMKLCTLNLIAVNNTPRRIKRIRINYKWGDTQTFAEFSDVGVRDQATVQTAMAGSVCDRIPNGATYDVSVCKMEGLSDASCKLRIAKQ